MNLIFWLPNLGRGGELTACTHIIIGKIVKEYKHIRRIGTLFIWKSFAIRSSEFRQTQKLYIVKIIFTLVDFG